MTQNRSDSSVMSPHESRDTDSEPGTRTRTRTREESEPGTRTRTRTREESEPGTRTRTLTRTPEVYEQGTRTRTRDESEPGTRTQTRTREDSQPGTRTRTRTREDSEPGTRTRTRTREDSETAKDSWDLPDTIDTGTPWKEMSGREKIKRSCINFIKVCALLGLLYMFICSLDFLSSSFRLLGGKFTGEAMSDVQLLSNPVAGLMIGVLATVLVQSSSTSTSIIVSMVSSELLPVRLAIPIIMGTNIGTTITNVLVSLGQIGDKDCFRRAFAGATLNDMFNWLSVGILLPLEVASGYLYHLSGLMVQNINADPNVKNPDLLKAITKPLTSKIIELDVSVMTDIAKGDNTSSTLIKSCCLKGGNLTCLKPCGHMFVHTTLSDVEVGVILLIMSLVILCACLISMVKILHTLLHGAIAKVVRKVVNAEFPGIFKHVTGYFVILLGAGLTFLVQSSSIMTATMTPLVGMGVIKLERLFPLVLGANIGTTFTSILAALASDSSGLRKSLQVSFCHLMFNLTGITIWYVIWPARKAPLALAKKLGSITAEYRWFPLLYIVFMFLVFPFLVFGLSMAGWRVLLGIAVPILLIAVIVIVMNVLQKSERTRHRLPERFQNWENMGVPLWMRSFQPLDNVITKARARCKCRCRNRNSASQDASNSSTLGSGTTSNYPIYTIKMGRKFTDSVLKESTV